MFRMNQICIRHTISLVLVVSFDTYSIIYSCEFCVPYGSILVYLYFYAVLKPVFLFSGTGIPYGM